MATPTIQSRETQERFDAGMRDVDHYKHAIPRWRYVIRQWLIPIVRWETPYIAFLQQKCRSGFLDVYFAITANLGTHTCFMTVLPILLWCGYTKFGRGLIHVLASGVFFSGFFKDLLCLPRPLSPPLQRITMSGSAALEYGFPSTHATNAVSVAVYSIYALDSADSALNPQVHVLLKLFSYFYAISIVLGRLYCGMHGFFDVVVGSLIGASLAALQCHYGEAFDQWIFAGTWRNPVLVTLLMLGFVWIHPEPADDCPCFDDSVAFAGVTIGTQVGTWHYATTGLDWDVPMPSTIPFALDKLGWPKTIARVVIGTLIIFSWRAVMKPLLLRCLPPLFRFVEQYGILLPRKFFVNASQYKKVPSLRKDDNVIPPASELAGKLNNLLRSNRRRVSIGPQSAADAYEALAYRDKRGRESLSSLPSISPQQSRCGLGTQSEDNYVTSPCRTAASQKPAGLHLLPTQAASRIHTYEQMMGSEDALHGPRHDPLSDACTDGDLHGPPFAHKHEPEHREVFSKLEKPRIRYDVEVITKLVVYAGIALLSTEVNPILFELCWLGTSTAGFSRKSG